jgi:hypothetical protein
VLIAAKILPLHLRLVAAVPMIDDLHCGGPFVRCVLFLEKCALVFLHDPCPFFWECSALRSCGVAVRAIVLMSDRKHSAGERRRFL